MCSNCALYKEGYSERSISERIKRTKNAVYNAVVKFKKTGAYSDAKRTGRPRKTTPRNDRMIRRTAVRFPISSARKIRSVLLAKGADISQRIVSRRLVINFGLKTRKPAKQPRLTQAMKAKRLSFAKKHAKWTIQQWQQVFFLMNLQSSSSLRASATSVGLLESDLLNGTPRRQ